MKRYIVKRDKKWVIVTPKYKKASKIYDNRDEAIVHAYNMETTSSVAIQGEDYKFKKLSQEQIKLIASKKKVNFKTGTNLKYIPRFVFQQSGDEQSLKVKRIHTILLTLIIAFIIISIIFTAMFLTEWKDF